MRVVIVDDDPGTQDVISLLLKAEEFEVYAAYNGFDGLKLVREHDADLVILDIQLPRMDGWEFCRQLRLISAVPILMLTATATQEADVIRGLELGADDFLQKPVRPRLLKAHIDALLRRSSYGDWRDRRETYSDPHLKVDLYHQEVIAAGERVSLSVLEYRLLALLVSKAGQDVATHEIVEALWAERGKEDYAQYVRIYVARLRRRIELDAHNPRYIATAHGVGYCFRPQS